MERCGSQRAPDRAVPHPVTATLPQRSRHIRFRARATSTCAWSEEYRSASPAAACSYAMIRPRSSKSPYRAIRDLHLYAGLFVSPFVLVYAISAIVLNHAYLPWTGGDEPIETRTIALRVPADTNALEVAKQIRAQLDIPGEIGFVNRNRRTQRISFPIETPGAITRVRFDPGSGSAEIERTETGVWAGMVYLHKIPGPHNVSIRGNWLATRVWGWVADASVYLLLFVSGSGIYLWAVVRAERKTGLLFLGAGALSFVLLMLGIVA